MAKCLFFIGLSILTSTFLIYLSFISPFSYSDILAPRVGDQDPRCQVELNTRDAVGDTTKANNSDLVMRDFREKSDINYFAFTPENLIESEHASWYANWTLSRQNDSRWSKIGEWKLFAVDFFQTRNLECGSFWTDCKDMPSLHDIQALYPDDRVLARRVYFTSECYLIIRNYLKAIQIILDEVNISLYGLVPEIIETFTSQPEPSAQAACAMIGVAVDTLINVGVTAVTGMMSSTVTSLFDKMEGNVASATHNVEAANMWYAKILASEWIPTSVEKWANSKSLPERVAKVFATPPKSGHSSHSKSELVPGLQKFNDFTQMPLNLRIGLRFGLQNLIRERMRLKLGSSSLGESGVCAKFNGGDKNKNAGNINQVQRHLASVFPRILESLSDLYDGIYNGTFQEKGYPSWMSTSMLSHNWAEETSYLQRMKQGSLMKREIMRAFTLNIASEVSASDGSYMKCTHKPWAVQKCNEMARAKPTDQAALAYFCPRPVNDPDLICQVGRWSLSSDYSHEMPWPALLKIEEFAANRFEFTRLELLNGAYDHYELNGNDLTTDWSSWFLGSLSSLSGLTMPVCKHDRLAMKDNVVHGFGHKGKGSNSLAVPNVCGINGSETEQFFSEVGFSEGSPAWKLRSKYEHWAGGGTNQLYNDRLVRANRDMFRTNPFMRYKTMCQQHIRFAEHADYKKYDAMNLLNHLRVHKGRDRDCDLVLNATKVMSEDQGNRWFCQKHREYGMDYGHTVFSREIRKIEIPRIPRDWVENHKHDCHKWLKIHGKGPSFTVPAIPGVPRPNKQERKKLRSKEEAIRAEEKRLDGEAERAFKQSLKSMNKKEKNAAKKLHKQQLKEAKNLRKNIHSLQSS